MKHPDSPLSVDADLSKHGLPPRGLIRHSSESKEIARDVEQWTARGVPSPEGAGSIPAVPEDSP